MINSFSHADAYISACTGGGKSMLLYTLAIDEVLSNKANVILVAPEGISNDMYGWIHDKIHAVHSSHRGHLTVLTSPNSPTDMQMYRIEQTINSWDRNCLFIDDAPGLLQDKYESMVVPLAKRCDLVVATRSEPRSKSKPKPRLQTLTALLREPSTCNKSKKLTHLQL